MTATQWLTRALCALLALALLLGSLLVIVEVGLAAAGREPWLVPYADWETWLLEHTWDDRVVIAILAGLVVLGLVLLFLAVRRSKPPTLPLRARTPGVDVTASRKSVEKSLVRAASRTPGSPRRRRRCAAAAPGSRPRQPPARSPAWSRRSSRP